MRFGQQLVLTLLVEGVLGALAEAATRGGSTATQKNVDDKAEPSLVSSLLSQDVEHGGGATSRNSRKRRELQFVESASDSFANGMGPPSAASMTFPMEDDFTQAQYEYWKAAFVPSDRIYNGANVKPSLNPYRFYSSVVVEAESGQKETVCGGALLSPLTVLTAARCVVALDQDDDEEMMARSDLWGVAVGLYCRRADNCEEALEWRPYSNVYIHPRYDSRRFLFDMAVIEFAEPVLGVQPVTPDIGGPASRKLLKWGADMTVVGLGVSSDEKEIERSSVLQELPVNYVSRDVCEGWWRSAFQGGVLCTYVDSFEGGPCGGDSGGPVLSFGKRRKQRRTSSSTPVLVATVSFSFNGDGCDKSKVRRLPDGNALVSAGRDDLWGPLICDSPSDPAASTTVEPPAWCQQLDPNLFVRANPATVASPKPPTPAPPPDLIDGIGIDPPDRYRYYSGVVLQDRFFDREFVGCGGVLIHPFFVLTLASCIDLISNSEFEDETERRFELLGARVGYQCENDCGEPVVFRESVQSVVHPQFVPSFRVPYDVGLIRFNDPVPADFVSKFPRLAVAGQDEDFTNDGDVNLRFVGFDKTPPEGDKSSTIPDLQRVTTTPRPPDECGAFVRSVLETNSPGEMEQKQSEELDESDLFLCTERQGVSGYCLSSFETYQFGAPLLLEKDEEDVLLGIANFRADETCSSDSGPEVFNRISTFRQWIECVVCVGATSIAQQGSLCASLDANLEEDCRDQYGITVGLYDIELLQDLIEQGQEGEDEDGPPPNCQVDEDRELSKSRFVWDPSSGKKKKCSKIPRRSVESLFCGERQEFLTDAREQCPHACGLCE